MAKRKTIRENRGFKGIWIPSYIWLNPNFTIQEIVFLAEIDSLDATDTGCYASNKYFSEFFALSKNRCSEIIKSLEEKKAIKVFYEYNRENPKQIDKRIIRVVEKSNTPIRNLDRPIRNLDTPYSENWEDNNTSINNTSNNTSNNKPSIKELTERFNTLWKEYPNKKGKEKAFKSYQKAIKDGVTDETIQQGINSYNQEIQFKRTDKQYIAHGSTWFNSRRWEDDYETGRHSNSQRQSTSNLGVEF
ncbi:helix-turn-helix domain-containing protein [Enterococcus rotai]|uniref:helix-turn-helix domain-containing protein n=1 Tax=Enterococcus rotai TaxID=118060 RepID=UPI0032B335C7